MKTDDIGCEPKAIARFFEDSLGRSYTGYLGHPLLTQTIVQSLTLTPKWPYPDFYVIILPDANRLKSQLLKLGAIDAQYRRSGGIVFT